jgi:hypothetical protein
MFPLLGVVSALLLEDLLLLLAQLLVDLGALGWLVAVCLGLDGMSVRFWELRIVRLTLTGAVASICESLSSKLKSLPAESSSSRLDSRSSLLAIERSSSIGDVSEMFHF